VPPSSADQKGGKILGLFRRSNSSANRSDLIVREREAAEKEWSQRFEVWIARLERAQKDHHAGLVNPQIASEVGPIPWVFPPLDGPAGMSSIMLHAFETQTVKTQLEYRRINAWATVGDGAAPQVVRASASTEATFWQSAQEFYAS
jgi:hypothetical protein